MRKIVFVLMCLVMMLQACKDDPVVIPAGLPDNHVNAIYIGSDGVKYFATNKGLASFDGTEWTAYYDNEKVTTKTIHDLDFEITTYGPEFWLGTNQGVDVASLPIDAMSGATTYTKSNTQTLFPGQPGLRGDSVFVVKVDGNNFRWFGTHEGLSVFKGNKWPAINFNNHYNTNYFKNFRITSMDYAHDTLYIGTMGGGIARMVATAGADAVSGASPYEIPWSFIPSENITAVFTDGSTQWYGSDDGLAKHVGTEAKENWTLYYKSDGLVHNYINAINKDMQGNMWIATKGGVSSFNGTTWTSYTQANGLISNNVLCLAVDIDGSLWFGTDNGVSHFNGSTWKTYQAE